MMKIRQRKRSWMIIAASMLAMLLLGYVHSSYRLARHRMLAAAAGFAAHTFVDPTGYRLPYRLLSPSPAEPGRQYPLVLFLHGSRENGDDNLKQLKYIADLFPPGERRARYPAYVLVPQCPRHQRWVERESYAGTITQAAQPTPVMQSILALLPAVERQYPIDQKRLYVLGVSSGGAGTWDVITRHPELFAAAVPFCGCGDAGKAPRLIHLPIWAFHGHHDVVVHPKTTRLMVAAITAAGGHPRYTEYPREGHSCWIRAFKDPAFLAWLFAQQRP